MGEEQHEYGTERQPDKTTVATCSCGWRSRRCRSLDGPSTAWMDHLDDVMPRVAAPLSVTPPSYSPL